MSYVVSITSPVTNITSRIYVSEPLRLVSIIV